MKGESKFINLLKSTRIKRILPVLVLILIPAAKMQTLPKEIFLLQLNVLLIYGASSIYNAHRDNDYTLPKTFPIIILAMMITAIIFAFQSKTILIASTLWILLGLLYNTAARYITLGDAMTLGATHFALPITTASILVNLQLESTLILTCTTYFLGISIMPNTNLKDIQKDKSINYKTLVNSTKNPEIVASAFLSFSIPIFAIIYLLLTQSTTSLLFLIPTIIICTITSTLMLSKKYKPAMNLMRIHLITAYIFLIILLTTSPKILITAFAISYLYISTLIIEKSKSQK